MKKKTEKFIRDGGSINQEAFYTIKKIPQEKGT